ncbi:MAG: hypothetical protein H8E90_00555 [Anaerolineales bacterium]|nr:hypothetical protein [Anaerolineales bacterium]
MKPIRLSGHARDNLRYRGATEEEVKEAIRTAPWGPAELGRLECRKGFPYGREWNKKVYATKRVQPIFVEEADEIVVVTVYVYYF